MKNINDYFRELPIPKSLSGDILDHGKKPIKILRHLSKLNVFIGPNNSGKSLLVREILKNDIDSEYPSKQKQQLYNQCIDFIIETISKEFTKKNIVQIQSDSYKINIRDFLSKFRYLDHSRTNLSIVHKINSELISQTTNQPFHTFYTSHNSHFAGGSQYWSENFKPLFDKIDTKYANVIEDLQYDEKFNRIYVPTTRTLRFYESNGILKDRTVNEYTFSDSPKSNYYKDLVIIENGESFYEDIFKLRNSGHANLQKLKEFEDFLQRNFFESQNIAIINNVDEKVLSIKIGKEKEQPIHNLGDGLQMIIILTFLLFNYENGIIAIEEPELFIHPGLQKKLMQIYTEHPNAQNFIFFVVTHSNHILDSVIQINDTSIYSMQKIISKDFINDSLPKFVLRPLEYGDHKFLNSIGIQNSSVFLSNCTIWVEGITDKLYIKRFINEYLKRSDLKPKFRNCKDFKEGINYNFIFSAGDNIIHNDFSDDLLITEIGEKVPVKFICGNALVVVDNDDDKNQNRKRSLKRKLKLKFYELPVVEIESLLPYEVILKAIQKFDSWKDLDLANVKSFKEKDYSYKRLGSFIDNDILNPYRSGRKRRKEFAVKPTSKNKNNLTLNCKIQFCENSLEEITHENMTKSSIQLVERILDFIKEKNK